VVRRESPDLSAAWWRTGDLPLMADEQIYRETMGQRRRRFADGEITWPTNSAIGKGKL
jgi:hypothetical protein